MPVSESSQPRKGWYTYRADGLRVSKTLGSGVLVTYTWDVNTGLPVIVQDSSYSYPANYWAGQLDK